MHWFDKTNLLNEKSIFKKDKLIMFLCVERKQGRFGVISMALNWNRKESAVHAPFMDIEITKLITNANRKPTHTQQ